MKIGFIDSGVGGLSIYQQVKTLVDAEYIYLMDNKYLPYGEKSESFIRQRLQQLSAFLIEQKANIIVIACNTATTQAVEYLRKQFSIPFVGVVPAVKPAAELGHPFAVLATPATCQSAYLNGLLQEFAPDTCIPCIGSSELVRLAEEKVWYKTDVTQQVADIISVSGLSDPAIRVVVLGCTHFPFLREEIKAGLSRDTILLDTADAIARRVQSLMADMFIRVEMEQEEKNNTFVSTRALNSRQLRQLCELGFDHYVCWPTPL